MIEISSVKLTPQTVYCKDTVKVEVELLYLQPHKGLYPHKGLHPVRSPWALYPEKGLHPHKGLYPRNGEKY